MTPHGKGFREQGITASKPRTGDEHLIDTAKEIADDGVRRQA
jgi:hypothetical protein